MLSKYELDLKIFADSIFEIPKMSYDFYMEIVNWLGLA